MLKARTRRRLWLAHRVLGLTSAAIFLIVALTGYLLLYQRELNLIGAEPLARSTPSVAGLDRGVAALAQRWAGHSPVTLIRPPRDDLAWIVLGAPREAAGATSIASIDPASGAVLGTGRFADTPLAMLWIAHNELYLGRPGRYLVLATGGLLIPLSLLGFVISSRRWRTLRSNPLKAKTPLRAMHRWAGLLAFPVIVAWAGTGVMLMASALNDPAHSITEAMPAHPMAMDAPIADIVGRVRGGDIFAISLPTHHDPAATIITVDRAAPPWAKFVMYRFDPASGALQGRMAMADAPLWPKTLEGSRALHMGLFERPLVHVVYLVAGILPLVMVVTGPLIWWRARRSERAAARQRQRQRDAREQG